MGPKSGWGGVQIGYVRPVQFLDHLTVIIKVKTNKMMFVWHFKLIAIFPFYEEQSDL